IFSKGIELKELINLFMPSQKYISDGSWLLMDRETKADDNAEHFYRYMMKNHPEKSCYFVLNKTAQDWDRLEKEGFNLVEFGSKDYEEHLRKADKIISSHLEKHINNYFGDLYEYSKKFVFLQHGVTQNNLSIWVNTKINLHCFITTALPEYKEIAANFNRYKLTEKEVVLAGFPRYDSLLSKSILRGKRILIMPTWRNYIVGKNIGNGSNRRIINNSFMETSYAQHWFSFLHSKELKLLAEKYEHKVTFAPHPNIEPYLPLFKVPSYIEIWKGEEATESIQNLFGDSSILITDYSSVAFDMAYLNKAVIYYQFDRDEFFSGAHTVQKGWFDYESSGFGPVTLTEQNTFDALKNILQSGLDNKYLTRIKETFPYQDDQNCERVYQTIVALDNPEERNNLPILKNMIVHAEQNQAWELAASRIQILFDENRLEQKELDDYWNRYLNALFNSKQFNKLQNLLLENPKYSQYWQAKIDLQIGNAIKGARFFAKENTIGSQEDFLIALLISAFYKDKENTKNLLKRLNKNLEKKYRSLLEIAKKILEQDYFVALALLKTYIDTIDMANRNSLKLELLASYIYMKLGNLQGAHQCLVTYEKHTKNDPSCRIAIARLSKLRGDFDKMFIQLNRAFEENLLLIPEDLVVDYLKKMLDSGNSEGEEYLLKQFRQKYSENLEIALYEAEKLYQAQNWKGLIKVIDEFVPTSREAAYFYIIALCRLKNDKTAQYYFNDLTAQDTLAYWKLAAEVAEVKGDKVLQAKCIRKQLEYLQ
ncbi:CDP-glycerol glycerophosphotransferase family protein, partial [Avibacterium avium]|uniref:CDP-glycerol glycerophosphotransferase family protein n=1 Tax=Avibacterium avium TaxID=751 RepID=UPI003BF808A7